MFKIDLDKNKGKNDNVLEWIGSILCCLGLFGGGFAIYLLLWTSL